MPIDINNTTQYQGVVSVAGSPQHDTVLNVVYLDQNNSPTKNSALIQKALDSSGNIYLDGTGTVFVNQRHVISSNTTVRKNTRLIIKQAPNIGKSLFVNAAYMANPTTVTLTWSSGNAFCTVNWTNHGIVAGDFVSIARVLPSSFVGVFRVASVTNANAFVVRLMRMPTSSPVATNFDGTTAGAVIQAKKADVNMDIQLDNLDYNYNENKTLATQYDENGCVFGYFAQSKIYINCYNSPKATLTVGSMRDSVITARNNNSLSDLLKLYGPAFNINAYGYGQASDDGLTYQTKEPSAFTFGVWSWGDILNCTASGDIDSTVSPFGVYTSPYEIVDNLTFDTCSGNSLSNSPFIKIWGNVSDNIAPITGTIAISSGAVSGTGTNFTVELRIGQTLYNNGSAVGTITNIANRFNATVSGGVDTTAGTTVTGSPGYTSGKFGTINFYNILDGGQDQTGTTGGEILQVQYVSGNKLNGSATFRPKTNTVSGFNLSAYIKEFALELTLDNSISVYDGNLIIPFGVVEQININKSSMDCNSTLSNLIWLISGGTVKNISITNSTIKNIGNIVGIDAGHLVRPTVLIMGNFMDTNKVMFCEGSQGYDVVVGGNLFNNMYNGVVRGATNTWNASLKSAGGNTLIGGSIWSGALVPATNKVWLYGLDINVDLSQHDKTKKGQMCVAESNTGTIVTGNIAVCDGTNWRQVSDTTKFV